MSVCSFIGTNNATTIEYHPQADEQVERYKKMIGTRLQHYVDEHQTNLDEFVQPLTYAYYTQALKSTGETPFSLRLSRHPPNPVGTSETKPPVDMNTSDVRQVKLAVLRCFTALF